MADETQPPLGEGEPVPPLVTEPPPVEPPPEKPTPEEAARNYLEELLHFHMPSHAEADLAIAKADYMAEKGELPPADWTPPESEKPPFTGGEVPVPGAAATAQAEAQKAFDEGNQPSQPAPAETAPAP